MRRGNVFAVRTMALLLAGSTGPAAGQVPPAALCPAGSVILQGTPDPDKLRGKRDPDCLIGAAGGDRLSGGPGNDLIWGGPGLDRMLGGTGDDVFLILGRCEVQRKEYIHGGRGNDTIRSPFSREQLTAMGVTIRSIEQFEIVTTGYQGGCVLTAAGPVCSCCDAPGFDPATGCSRCVDGMYLDDGGRGAGDATGSLHGAPRCLARTTCADLDCGLHGTCVESDTGASCGCDPGYAGDTCDTCAAPFESTADGRCVLGRTCARERCGGHGLCRYDAETAGVECQCDPGWDTPPDCGGPNTSIGGPGFFALDDGPQTFSVALANGEHCTTGFSWSVVAGGGGVVPDSTDSTRATYTPPPAIDGRVAHVQLQATCGNNPKLGGTRNVVVGAPSAAGEPPGFVSGACAPEVAAAFDAAVLEYMEAQDIRGATVAITYQENVVCLRGYGLAAFHLDPFSLDFRFMRPCTPMRVASVTKPFTRAALRGNLYGQSLAPEQGVGTVGDTTPVLPILDDFLGLGPNGEVPWQAPAAIYNANYPPFILPSLGLPVCNPARGVVDSGWSSMTITHLLDHTSGLPPNTNYLFAPTLGTCTGAPGEVCGSRAGIGDPTVSASTVMRMPNDLGLAVGVVGMDDAVRWISGTCLYDSPLAARFRYSNVGFTVAGKLVELLSGQSYEEYVVRFLTSDGIIDIDAPGSPIVYLGQSKGGGPRTYTLPEWLREARYFSKLSPMTDVTAPVLDTDSGLWTFPSVVAAPEGGANFDIMGPHGGLVMNALALAKFGSEYRISTGTPRSLARGGPGRWTYSPADGSIAHTGLLFGTSSLTWELSTSDFQNALNPNGPGCLIPGDTTDADDPDIDANPANDSGVNALEVEPCPIPAGIRISVLFNGDVIQPADAAFVRGRHDGALLWHRLRRAASQVGETAVEWGKLSPLSDTDLRLDCDIKCPLGGKCVHVNCGNGTQEDGEQCDDGNNNSGDTCNADCTLPSSEPGGYADCAGEYPGTCLGGPCAPREDLPNDSDLLNPYSPAHPDGNFSRNHFCHDYQTAGLPWQEATCVATTHMGKTFGVCRECGVDTMTGCVCPAIGQEDGGCNMGGAFDGYSCAGGRCWKGLPPKWMCTADCDNDIYGTGGYCYHDDPKGAVCYHHFCSEPVDTYCAQEFGAVCDVNVIGCTNDSCCKPECLNDTDCSTLGYSAGHFCSQERCVLAP